MTPERDPARGQLDIPLVWETEARAGADRRPPAAVPPASLPPRAAPATAGRLILAALADLGCALLAFAAAWATAVAAGASGHPGQLAAIAASSLLVAAAAGCGALWGWRGTPGMLLLDIAFVRPLPARIVPRVWVGWLVALPLGGLPLAIGRAGGRGLERLGGAPVSQRRLRAGA